MIAYSVRDKSAERLQQAADFLRACSSTHPTQQNLQMIDAFVESIHLAVGSGEKQSLRELVKKADGFNAPTHDLLAAAQHIVQSEIMFSSMPRVSDQIREVAETIRENSFPSMSDSRLYVAAG